jgi:uncharacterized protein YndB with AHSA1/START domain
MVEPVTNSVLDFGQQYDLPRSIVWDALVDSDLVGGWLAEAEIDPRIGGRYDLSWHSPIATGTTLGEIADLLEPELLVVELERVGTVTFSLSAVQAGSRGESTLLSVSISAETEPRLADGVSAAWLTSLEQLEELLRGRPVDWSTWRVDHGEQWIAHLERLRSA